MSELSWAPAVGGGEPSAEEAGGGPEPGQADAAGRAAEKALASPGKAAGLRTTEGLPNFGQKSM